MGAIVSKSTTDDIKDDSSESSLPSAPILTPQVRKLDWDPRSPSSDIARTPIEVLKTPITSGGPTPTSNHLNLTEDLNEDTETNTLNHLHSLDPRSPTTEFHRTPIITDATLKLQKLHNKNLDNVRAPLVAITPLKPKKISEKVVKKIYGTPEVDSTKLCSPKLLSTPIITVNPPDNKRHSVVGVVSPKLLESSPITFKPPENKRHSVVGLLETNLDFVETDLDKVIQSKTNAEIALGVLEKSTTFTLTPEDKRSNSSNLNSSRKVSYADSESDCDIEDYIEETFTHTEETCMFYMKSEELAKIVQEVHNISEVDVNNGSIVDELDRKLTNLIYEDKQAEASPKPSKPMDNNHTPLRDRNINSQQPKSIPKLKVSDKPTKPFGGASRIPVFKEKRLKGKINVQCENTPPRIKRSQWDPEDSIII